MRGAPLHYSSPKHYKTYLLIFFWVGGGAQLKWIFLCLLFASLTLMWIRIRILRELLHPDCPDLQRECGSCEKYPKMEKKNLTKKSLQKHATTVIWTHLLFRLCNLVVTDLFSQVLFPLSFLVNMDRDLHLGRNFGSDSECGFRINCSV